MIKNHRMFDPSLTDSIGQLDCVYRFAIEKESVRGQCVRLGPAWQELREYADYPPSVSELLGQATCAVILLAATLKFEGELTLQLQGDGPLRLVVAQCTHDFKIRAVARFDRERIASQMRFNQLVGQGQIVVTIESGAIGSRYQGIVSINESSLAASLDNYFNHSEQLPTRVVLAAAAGTAAGLLVQRMPDHGGNADFLSIEMNPFEAADAALTRLTTDELLVRPINDLLQSVMLGYDLRLLKLHTVRFECRCNKQRVSSMLRSLGQIEVDSIIAEQGAVTVTCEFCQRPWVFDAIDADSIFAEAKITASVSIPDSGVARAS